MPIFIILIIALVVGAILWRVGSNNSGILSTIIGMCLTSFAAIALLISGSYAIEANVNVFKDYYYENAVYEREVLECCLESQDTNFMNNELLYSDIVEFNNALEEKKRLADSPWVGIFINQKIADLEYIDIGDTTPVR